MRRGGKDERAEDSTATEEISRRKVLVSQNFQCPRNNTPPSFSTARRVKQVSSMLRGCGASQEVSKASRDTFPFKVAAALLAPRILKFPPPKHRLHLLQNRKRPFALYCSHTTRLQRSQKEANAVLLRAFRRSEVQATAPRNRPARTQASSIAPLPKIAAHSDAACFLG